MIRNARNNLWLMWSVCAICCVPWRRSAARSLARPRCNSILWLMCRLHAHSPVCLHPLFPTYLVLHNSRLTTPAHSLSRARLHAPYALALSRSFALCTVPATPSQSCRKRPHIRILPRALYVHRTGRVYVLTVYICIIQCSRERYRVCGRACRRPENPRYAAGE